MALAGPAANFTLVILSAVGIRVGMLLGYFHMPAYVGFTRITEASTPGMAGFAAIFLSIIFLLNLLLGTFNLLPEPPLVGDHIIHERRCIAEIYELVAFAGLWDAGIAAGLARPRGNVSSHQTWLQ